MGGVPSSEAAQELERHADAAGEAGSNRYNTPPVIAQILLDAGLLAVPQRLVQQRQIQAPSREAKGEGHVEVGVVDCKRSHPARQVKHGSREPALSHAKPFSEAPEQGSSP